MNPEEVWKRLVGQTDAPIPTLAEVLREVCGVDEADEISEQEAFRTIEKGNSLFDMSLLRELTKRGGPGMGNREVWLALFVGGAVAIALLWRWQKQVQRSRAGVRREERPLPSQPEGLRMVVVVPGDRVEGIVPGSEVDGSRAASWVGQATHWRKLGAEAAGELAHLDLGGSEITSRLDEFLVVLELPLAAVANVRRASSSGAIADVLSDAPRLLVVQVGRIASTKGFDTFFART